MGQFLTSFVVVVSILVLAGAHGRADVVLNATITHDQETMQGPLLTSTGDPRPLSFGTATFVLNEAQTALTFTATIFNIDVTGSQTPDTFDNLSAAHIHAPAPPGMNAGVRWGFFGAPFNDNNPNDFVLSPFAVGTGGMLSGKWDVNEGNATTLTAQVPDILAGLSYINFHTVQFPGGEIRGQIIPVAVPEPGSLALTGLLGGIALVSRAAGRRLRRPGR